MTSTNQSLTYPYPEPPAFGTTAEIAPGVKWLQMPLPMSLKYINLYLIEEDAGWVLIDTGIRGSKTRDLWPQIINNELDGKPISRIICTHMHPDHTGQAGYLSENWKIPLYMSSAEYYQAKNMNNMMREGDNWQASEFFQRAGIDKTTLESMHKMRSVFASKPNDYPLPNSFSRLSDGDTLQLGKNEWQVITGNGHSPEHVCLYCPQLQMLISGDQILPVITSNVSVHPIEPEANPLVDWLQSHERFKTLLPDDILVLPSHNLPFYGVQQRLQQLIDHHEDRMLILEETCIEPQIATDLLPHLFARKLEGFTRIMALGECIAHLHCLMSRNRIQRTLLNGVYSYQSIDGSLGDRASPGKHEALEDEPGMV